MSTFLKMMILSVAFFASSAFADCGGTCYGTSSNPYHNAACQGASVNGQRACQSYSGLGCVWQPRVELPGRCYGTSPNPYQNAACDGASVNGQLACQKYSGLGCVWQPAQCR